MGTRSQTIVVNTDNEKYLQLYRQMDGYPSGHGQDLLDVIMAGEVVNGYNDKDAKQFNGPGCFAAQLVAALKTGVGQFYMEPHDYALQENDYTYQIVVPEAGGEFNILVWSWDELVFEGNPKLMKAWIKSEED